MYEENEYLESDVVNADAMQLLPSLSNIPSYSIPTNTSLAPIVAVKTVSVTPTIKAMADLSVINAPLKAAAVWI